MLKTKFIKLPIYHHTDASDSLAALEIQAGLDMCDVQDVYFFTIDAVSEYKEEDRVCSIVHCNGVEFLCDLHVDVVLAKIAKAFNT